MREIHDDQLRIHAEGDALHRGHGAILHRCAPGIPAREAACAQVLADTGATLVHPYADPAVIAGQGTAALELFGECGPLDALVVPVGGGGLAAGSGRYPAGTVLMRRF